MGMTFDPQQIHVHGKLTDAWEAGLQVKYVLDEKGGTPGWVSAPFMSYTIVGVGVKNFVYGNLNVLDNQSDNGENCAGYDKGIKNAKGPTWGRVIEVNDKEGHEGAAVALEADVFVAGKAADPDIGPTDQGGRARVGVDIVGGDQAFKEDGKTNTGAQGTYGFHVYATSTTPWFRWFVGGRITDFLRSGLRIVGKKLGDWTPERMIDLQGDAVVGIDFSRANLQSIFRVKRGQRIPLDEYDDLCLSRQGNEFTLEKNVEVSPGKYEKRPFFRIDMDGNVYGKKFIEIK